MRFWENSKIISFEILLFLSDFEYFISKIPSVYINKESSQNETKQKNKNQKNQKSKKKKNNKKTKTKKNLKPATQNGLFQKLTKFNFFECFFVFFSDELRAKLHSIIEQKKKQRKGLIPKSIKTENFDDAEQKFSEKKKKNSFSSFDASYPITEMEIIHGMKKVCVCVFLKEKNCDTNFLCL